MRNMANCLIFALAALCLGGCVSMLDGPSSAERKAELIRGSFLTGADVLAMKREGGHLKQNEKLARLATQDAFDLVVRVHRAKCAEIARQWSVALDCAVIPTLEYADLGGPYVAISGGSTIRLDPEVVRVMYREAVLGFLREHGVPRFKRPPALPASPSDDELIHAFSDLWQEVKAAPVSTRDAVKFAESPTKAQAEEEKAWARLDQLILHKDEVKTGMAGGITFLLAHTLGHHVLRHARLSPATVADFLHAEADADVYAARLFTAIFRSSALFDYSQLSSESKHMELVASFYSLPSRLTESFEIPWYSARPELPKVISPQPDRLTVVTGEYDKLLQEVQYRDKEWTKLTIGWK